MSKTTVSPKKRREIAEQSLKEIEFSRRIKQNKIWGWHKNENLYYAKKEIIHTPRNTEDKSHNPPSRANVELGKMQSFIHTALSKIDSPLIFKFKATTPADNKKADLTNALRVKDADRDYWNMKDIMGKKQGLLYGRAVYAYSASSDKGYRPHLENIDVYDFLIDPSVGGLDIDNARYLGRYGVELNERQLKSNIYIKSEVKNLKENYTDRTQEDIDKQNRYLPQFSTTNRRIDTPGLYRFWEWFTTYEGVRYYVLISPSGDVVRLEKLTDMFLEQEELGDAMWPFWTWAAFPDLTEFWSPSYADYVREIFYAQSVSINQMLDNGEKVNKPQRYVDVQSLIDPSELEYKRNGVIRTRPGADLSRVFRQVDTPSIESPLKVYDKLEQIQQLESGVTASARGVAEEDKVGIYEGNVAQTADRFGLLEKSYSHGYHRFALLWHNGVQENLTKEEAIDFVGSQGFEKTVFIKNTDIKPSSKFRYLVESSNAESLSNAVDKKNKIQFLASYKGDEIQNQLTAYEVGAKIAGFTDDEILSLTDKSDTAKSKVIGEAERDIESLLDGEDIEANEIANTSYMAHIERYMKDHKEDMDDDTFQLFVAYMDKVSEMVIRNAADKLAEEQAKAGILNGQQGQEDVSGGGRTQLANVDPEEELLTTNPLLDEQQQA